MTPVPPALEINCPSCGKDLKAPANLAGRRVKCPKCKAPITIPTQAPQQPAAKTGLELIASDSSEQRALTQSCPSCDAACGDVARCPACGCELRDASSLNPRKDGQIQENGAKNTLGRGWGGFIPFLKALPDAFGFPFRGAGIPMILSMPFIWIVNFIPTLGGLIFVSIFYAFYLEAVRSAAARPKAKPEFPHVASEFSECVWRTLRLEFLTMVLLAPVLIIAWVFFGEVDFDEGVGAKLTLANTALLAAMGAFLFYFPMAFLLFAIYDSVLAALNPFNVGRSIAAAPLAYLACVVIYLGLGSVQIAASNQLEFMFGWAAGPIDAAVGMALSLLGAGVLGALHRQQTV